MKRGPKLSVKMLYEAKDELVSLLQQLIRFNTTNPPGNETPAAEFLKEVLENEGFKCELLESSPSRGNVITRIKGTNRKPSLLLLSHLDVVAANPDEWSVDPFAGTVKDGFIWGRGALDMKSMTAVEVMLMKLLKRNGVKPKGDIIFAATADEEMGGGAGVEWLVKNHPEKIKADYVINEGGGFAIPVKNRNIYTVQTAEKAIVWIKIRAKGTPGHGSIPGAADNAVLRMAETVRLLGNHRSKIKLVSTVKRNLEELSKGAGFQQRLFGKLLANPLIADKILDMMAKKERALAESIRAMLRTTIAPTIIHGGVKENVIPSRCEAVFDCRILPGQSKETLLAEIKRVLEKVGLEKLEFEILQENTPTESPFDTPLYRTIEKTLREFDPNCRVTPFMMTGGTDSRFLREIGCVCYGFAPMKPDLPLNEFLRMAHGIDERISIENLVFSLSVLYRLVEKFMT